MTTKIRVFAAIALACAAAVSLSACVPPGLKMESNPAAAASPSSAADQLALLKEANSHIEKCHRTYTFAWPPTGTWDCPATGQASSQGLSAADIAAIVSAAVVKAIALMPPPAPPSPAPAP